jgi:hypothetical protein
LATCHFTRIADSSFTLSRGIRTSIRSAMINQFPDGLNDMAVTWQKGEFKWFA